MEFGNHLDSHSREPTALNRDVETSFPVDKTRDVLTEPRVWPFLLIVCTQRIITLLQRVP